MKKINDLIYSSGEKKEGKAESLTLSDGQYYSENIFPQSKELAAEMGQISLLSMLVPTRVFVHKNNIYLDEVHVDLDNVPSQIISAHSKQTMSKFSRSRGIYNSARRGKIR